MLSLPKVDKGVKRAMTRTEKIQKVVVGVAVALGVTFAAMPAQASQMPTSQVAKEMTVVSEGALLLTPSTQLMQIAQHGSHWSHSSHASHASHASHYSSRY